MALKLNGSTGYLEHPAALVAAYPFSMAVWVSRDVSSGDQFTVAQSRIDGDFFAAGQLQGTSEIKNIILRTPLGSVVKQKTTTPDASATMKLMVVVFESLSSRVLYFGDNVAATDTYSYPANESPANYNMTTVGALRYNSVAATGFVNGSVAEAHYFSVALTPTNIADMIADTAKPEAITGWVDGWTFKDYNAGGTYTSIGGTRTMTAVGGVVADANHPIARGAGDTTLPTQGGTIAISSVTSSGFKMDWSAGADNVGVAGYEVSVVAGAGADNFVNVGNVLTITETGKAASTQYTVKVRNYDAALNRSTPISGTVTTAAAASTVSGVTVSPATPSVVGGSTQQFTAVVAGTNSPSQTVSWAAAAGSINSSGLFTAPVATGSAQTITITATSSQDNTKSGTATVTVPAAGVAGGTITSDEYRNWSGTLLPNLVVENVVVIKMSDRTIPLAQANLTTNAQGRLVITNAALVTGTDYMLGSFNPDGTVRGFKKVTAT